MAEILVTGGTGSLGRPTVARLRAAGHTVRILTRHAGASVEELHTQADQPSGAAAVVDAVRNTSVHDVVVTERAEQDHDHGPTHLGHGHLVHGDLVHNDGIDAALEGVDTVIHLATTNGKRDVTAAANLIRASERAGVAHLILISIVGIDEIPLALYKAKLEVESLLEESTVPHTILRATQFHSFVVQLFTAQRWLPMVFAPRFSFQPISVDDVALRLVELAEGNAAGRVADIGGPERRTAFNLARTWAKAAHIRRPVARLSLPGATFSAFAAGHNLVPGEPFGTTTFENYLATRYNGTSH